MYSKKELFFLFWKIKCMAGVSKKYGRVLSFCSCPKTTGCACFRLRAASPAQLNQLIRPYRPFFGGWMRQWQRWWWYYVLHPIPPLRAWFSPILLCFKCFSYLYKLIWYILVTMRKYSQWGHDKNLWLRSSQSLLAYTRRQADSNGGVTFIAVVIHLL